MNMETLKKVMLLGPPSTRLEEYEAIETLILTEGLAFEVTHPYAIANSSDLSHDTEEMTKAALKALENCQVLYLLPYWDKTRFGTFITDQAKRLDIQVTAVESLKIKLKA